MDGQTPTPATAPDTEQTSAAAPQQQQQQRPKTYKPHYHSMSYAQATATSTSTHAPRYRTGKNEPAGHTASGGGGGGGGGYNDNGYYYRDLLDNRAPPMSRVTTVAVDCESLGPNAYKHDMPAFGAAEWSDWQHSSDFWRSPPTLVKSSRWLMPFDMARSDPSTIEGFWKASSDRWAMLMSWKLDVDSRPDLTEQAVARDFVSWLEETEMRLFTSGSPPPTVVSDAVFYDVKLIENLLDRTETRPSLAYNRVFKPGTVETESFVYGHQPRSISDSFRCLLPGGMDKHRGVQTFLRYQMNIAIPDYIKGKTHDPRHDSELAGYLYCMLRRAAICRDEHQRYSMYPHNAWRGSVDCASASDPGGLSLGVEYKTLRPMVGMVL